MFDCGNSCVIIAQQCPAMLRNFQCSTTALSQRASLRLTTSEREIGCFHRLDSEPDECELWKKEQLSKISGKSELKKQSLKNLPLFCAQRHWADELIPVVPFASIDSQVTTLEPLLNPSHHKIVLDLPQLLISFLRPVANLTPSDFRAISFQHTSTGLNIYTPTR